MSNTTTAASRVSELQNQIKTSLIELAWLMSVGDRGSLDYDNTFSNLRSAQDELESIVA